MVTGDQCAVTSPTLADASGGGGGGGRQSTEEDARIDIAFIDEGGEADGVEAEVTAESDAVACDGSDDGHREHADASVVNGVERTDVNGGGDEGDGRTASPSGGNSPEMAPSPAARAGGVSPQPLKSALRSGSTRRRLQVVINESRNTYCEATESADCEGEEEEDVPRLVSVRAFSFSLPELLSFEPAVQLSPPAAYRDMVAEDELCQETAVDDSEGSECSGDGLEVPPGPAPLASLDDLALTPAEDSPPEGSDTQPEDGDREEQGQTAETAAPEAEVAPSPAINAEAAPDADSADVKTTDEQLSSSSSSSTDSSQTLQATAALSGGGWRNLPDLVTDGAPAQPAETSPPPAGSESASPSPPTSPSSPQTSPTSSSSSVLTLANVQQHDKVIAIADRRTEGLLQGILKGGRLWGGGVRSVSDSDDSDICQQQRRSVRFTRQQDCERPPVVVPLGPPPPVPTESDGESSISSMDTVIAVALGAEPGRAAAAVAAATAAAVAPPGQAEGVVGAPGTSSEAAAGPLQVAALAQAVVGGRSSAEVARAIHHNALRRSLARGDPSAAAAGTTELPPSVRRQVAAGELSGSCPNLCLASPERGTPSETSTDPPVVSRTPFSPPPPDIQVPGDVREWKLSERLWPPESPTPAQRQPLDRLDTLLAVRGSPPRPEPRRRSLDVPERRADPAAVLQDVRPATVQIPAAPEANATNLVPPPRQGARPETAIPAPRLAPELAKRLAGEPAAGDRDSAASSAESRDSYSLDDIDEALVTERVTDGDAEPVRSPPWSPPPAGVKEGSADSGYGSNDGRAPESEPVCDGAEAECDELAAFADLQADRTERLRRRYNTGGGGGAAEFARQSSVRGIRPRFEATSEILRQMQQQQVPPRWARPRDWRLPPVEEAAPAGPEPARRQPVPPPQHDWAPSAQLPQGYVYPQYQPPRGPPLPPRHGQVRPTAAAAPVGNSGTQHARRAIHQSAPNLYQPAPERRPPPPPVAPPQMQPLSRTVSSTLPMRIQEDYRSYGQHVSQWNSGPQPGATEQRQMQSDQRLRRGGHQRSLSGPYRTPEYHHQLHQQQRQHQPQQQLHQQQLQQNQHLQHPQLPQQHPPHQQLHYQKQLPQYPPHQQQYYQHQLQQHQQHEWLRRQQSAGGEPWRRPPPASRPVPTRPFSSADMYPRLREPPAGHFTPQPYIHDI